MPNRSRIFYVALGLIFIVSIGYRIRETIDRFEFLLHPQDHVRNPFTMDLPAVELIDPEPDGTSAGLQAGDELVAFAGRPFRGAVDYYAHYAMRAPATA